MDSPHQVASNPKEIIDRTVDGEKTLDVAGRFEAPHLPFALARRLMRDLSAVVGVLLGAVRHGRYEGLMSSRIATQLIRNESVGDIL